MKTPVRLGLVILTCAGMLVMVSQLLVNPSLGRPVLRPYQFPPSLTFGTYQAQPRFQARQLIGPKIATAHSEGHYQSPPFELDMRYFYDGATVNGDVVTYNQSYLPTAVSGSSEIRGKPETGLYQLFTYEGRAYLSACINPRGTSTVTAAQFLAHRQALDHGPQRFAAWVLNQEYWLDRRCLWSQISLPLSQDSLPTAYTRLEQVWLPWYAWWREHFPPV